MRKGKFTESQIVGILKKADAGIAIKDLVRSHGISVATYYKWKSRYGSMDVVGVGHPPSLPTDTPPDPPAPSGKPWFPLALLAGRATVRRGWCLLLAAALALCLLLWATCSFYARLLQFLLPPSAPKACRDSTFHLFWRFTT